MTHPQPEFGTMISEFASINVVRVCRKAGFAFVIVDCEHGAFTTADVAALKAATPDGMRLLVRVPVLRREFVGRYLDAGADGIVVPMVDGVEMVERAVELAKYPPLGRRGVSLTRAHSGFGVEDQVAYQGQANARVAVYPQIETVEALESVEQIARVPGVSGMFVGPNDLLLALGDPGNNSNAELHAALSRVGQAAREAGVDAGIITGSETLLRSAGVAGMKLFCVGSDVSHLISGGRQALARAERAAAG